MLANLASYEANRRNLPGAANAIARNVLVAQLIESVRRLEFISLIQQRPISASRGDPKSPNFDPIRAAILKAQVGDIDEAYWLVFLSTHFGKHRQDGWALARDFYGALGKGPNWTWQRVSGDIPAFRQWLVANEAGFSIGGKRHRFGNHRKYESISATKANGTGAIVESYVRWALKYGGHAQLVRNIHQRVGQNPVDVFDEMCLAMDEVHRFGRLANFDHVAMLGKLGIAPVIPGRPHLRGATGPLKGARLLFGNPVGGARVQNLENWCVELAADLAVNGQVIEDALCNWQKSPNKFIAFR